MFVARWVGLKALNAMVVVLALVASFVSLELVVALLSLFVASLVVVFRTGSGVRTPLVTLSEAVARGRLSLPELPLRTVAIVSESSRTVVTMFVSCRLAFVWSCSVWLRVERHLRETFTAAFSVPPTPMGSTF